VVVILWYAFLREQGCCAVGKSTARLRVSQAMCVPWRRVTRRCSCMVRFLCSLECGPTLEISRWFKRRVNFGLFICLCSKFWQIGCCGKGRKASLHATEYVVRRSDLRDFWGWKLLPAPRLRTTPCEARCVHVVGGLGAERKAKTNSWRGHTIMQ